MLCHLFLKIIIGDLSPPPFAIRLIRLQVLARLPLLLFVLHQDHFGVDDRLLREELGLFGLRLIDLQREYLI
jgi:hypothetical protein